MNPEIIAKIMPGCDKLEEVGENAYEGAMNIKIGPVQGKFQGNVELSDLQEPESYHLKMKGKGAPGFVEATGLLKLTEDAGTTTLDYEVDAKIGGRIASVGQRLLESSTKVISRQSLEGLDEQVKAIMENREAEAPTQTTMAAGFTRGMLEEFAPVVGTGLGLGLGALLFGFFFLLMRGCGM